VLGPAGLQGRRFLDIGSGSGLFSLAAYRLGAEVTSFDYDADSVGCTQELRRREHASESRWQVEQGSVLDADYLASLGTYDVVYSWGVLHHTGQMWTAIDLASQRVAEQGTLWIALYNDQGVWSRVWAGVKQLYVRLPSWLRPVYVVVVGFPWASTRVMAKLTARVLQLGFQGLNGGKVPPPMADRKAGLMASQRVRGMHWWYDLVDWIGGFPFEVAKPDDVVAFLRDRGFVLEQITTCGGNLGCNEFVFRRAGDA
jgi:SAM-dependent methyltransferase